MITRSKVRLLAAVAFGLAGLVPFTADAAILKRVHAGTTTVSSTSGNTIALELPDASKAFVVCAARTTNSNSNSRATCVLSDNSLLIDVGSSTGNNTVIVSWYVAEFDRGVTVQRNTAAVGSGATSVTATLTPAVDCSKSFVVMAGEQTNASNGNNNDEQFAFLGVLGTVASPCGVASSTSTLTISRLESGNAATVAWQVVTMDGATVMARDTATIAIDSLTATNTIPSTDSTRSFLLMSRQAGTSTGGNEPIYLTRADFSTCAGSPLSCTGVTFTRGRADGNNNKHIQVAYEVVRLDDGGSVQRGSTVSSGTTTTMGAAGNISAIDRAGSVPFFTASVAGNDNQFLDDGLWTVDFTSTTQLQFTRGVSVSTVGTANWFVVSFYKCANGRVCSVGATAGNATATVTWSPLYDPQCLSGSTPTSCQGLVVRDVNPITWTPSNGTTYTVGNQPSGGPSTMRVAFNGTGQSVPQSSLTNGQQYYYRVFPRVNGTTNYVFDSGMSQAISQVSATPSANANLAWSYMTTGGSTLNPPIAGDGRMYIASNGSKMIALNSATGLEVATPVITPGAVQSYLAWLPVSGGGEAVIAGDQKGWVTHMDGVTGLPVWTRKMAVDASGYIQADLSAQLVAYANLGSPPCDGGAFGGAYSLDQLYVSSRNGSQTDNKVWAVPVDTDGQSSLSWTFDPAASIDRSAGQPYVDYCRNRLWLTTGAGSGGTQKSIWVINTLTGAEVTTSIADGAGVGELGNLTNSSPALSFDLNTLWVGNAAGKLFAINAAAATPSLKYSRQLTGTSPAITGFVWEDWTTPGRLYIPVTVGGNGGVWCVQDNGASLTPCADWSSQNPRTVTSGAVAQPFVTGTAIFFPGSDGKLYQIDTTTGLTVGSGLTVESGVALGGLSTEDGTQLFVGSSTGRTYRINLVGGNLP